MNPHGPATQLARWVRRAAPAPGDLARALLAGTLAEFTGLALLVGAPYLLLYSASHRHLVAGSTLAVLLIVIELLAFARSPLRFAERLAAHDLGLRSVTAWRRWLAVTVGAWPYARWSAASTGDLLERALGDTDVLQDLWLRALVPFGAAALSALAADLAVALWSPVGVDGPAAALVLAASQCLFTCILGAQFGSMVRDERLVRHARAARTAARVELQAAAAELALLGGAERVAERIQRHGAHVARRERRRDHRDLLNSVLVAAGPLVAIGALEVFARRGAYLAGRDAAVVLLLAVATGELLNVTRQTLRVATTVTAAAERLDDLAYVAPFGSRPWPQHEMLDVEGLSWRLGDQSVLTNVTFTVAPGRRVAVVGDNGAGKSTLLRLLARLEETPPGAVRVGHDDLVDLDELVLRRHLAYVAADPGLLSGLVDQVVRVGRVSADEPDAALRALGITRSSADRFEHLSRGEAQRVALVRGLLDEPSIVLLDEPTSGLGRAECDQVLAWLDQRHATVVVATHDPEVVAWCDDVYELADGEIRLLSR